MYLSAAELLDLEHARLRLRRYGFVLDRGRLVREAIAILLADLDVRGKDSLVARRIRSLQETGADHDGSQGKDEDAVPSLGTTLFFDISGYGYYGARAKKRVVLWAQRQAR